MQTLILTTNDCSAGRLKASKVGKRVIPLCQRLIEGPLQSDEEQSRCFGYLRVDSEEAADADHWQAWISLPSLRKLNNLRPSLVETCREYDRIEIWIDPDPNSYLILLQLIAALKSNHEILERLFLAFPPRYVGELSAGAFESSRPLPQPLTSPQLELASRAWNAYRSETPEALFSLLKSDLTGMPHLRGYLLRILSELPAVTNGLSASEAQLLALINSKFANFGSVFSGYVQLRPRPTLDYWEVGRRIVTLSRCDPPIILGVEEESFSLDLHIDKTRFDAFRARNWSLSALGRRIEMGRDDLCKHLSVDRWLGNIHLRSDHLWRWDAITETIVDSK